MVYVKKAALYYIDYNDRGTHTTWRLHRSVRSRRTLSKRYYSGSILCDAHIFRHVFRRWTLYVLLSYKALPYSIVYNSTQIILPAYYTGCRSPMSIYCMPRPTCRPKPTPTPPPPPPDICPCPRSPIHIHTHTLSEHAHDTALAHTSMSTPAPIALSSTRSTAPALLEPAPASTHPHPAMYCITLSYLLLGIPNTTPRPRLASPSPPHRASRHNYLTCSRKRGI